MIMILWSSCDGSVVGEPDWQPCGHGFDLWPCSVGGGSSVAMSCGIDHRCGLDLALLWLWRRLVATALIGPLAWEPPYALGVVLERPKKKKKVILIPEWPECVCVCVRERERESLLDHQSLIRLPAMWQHCPYPPSVGLNEAMKVLTPWQA